VFFATAMPMSGAGMGLLVESHEGRPTKIEGNPDHPSSRGATDLFAQASILGLYDPDRHARSRTSVISAVQRVFDAMRARWSAGGQTG
jgi:molybdopterin-containing oxidoreductase family iron-sulfur binding subunit